MKPHVGGAFALLATAAALTLPCGDALAAAGTLDPSFDRDGRRVLPNYGRPAAVLVQPDGKIVVAGTTAEDKLAAWRLNANGSLDSRFDGDGTAIVKSEAPTEATAAALQADGKILLAGTSYPVKGAHPVIVRLNANGSPDDSFKPGGEEMLAGAGLDRISSVLVQRDGRIVLAGRAGDDFGALRLYSTGSTDGTVFEPVQFGGNDTPAAAALGPNGTIVLAGTTVEVKDDPVPAIAVARYRADGKLDASFAGTGKRTLGAGLGAAVVAPGDGKVVVQSRSLDADARVLVHRLTAKGALDGAFGRGGTAIIDLHGPDLPAGVALQRDGRILVAGSAGYDFAAARLTTGGVLDTTYGARGASLFGFTGVNLASAAALQPDGRLVMAGRTTVGSTERLAIARLLADPPPGAARDRVAPSVSGLTASARRVRFTLSEPADVRVVVERKRRGRRARVVRKRLLAARPAGANTARLRIRARGRYRVTVTATDRAGNRSRPRRASFRLTHR